MMPHDIHNRFLTLLSALLVCTGCPQQPAEQNNTTTTNNTQKQNNPQNVANYEQMCASCHGTFGEGGLAPALHGWSKGRPQLVQAIDERMPTEDPTKCKDQCASDMADFILALPKPEACEPDDIKPAPKRLRLLSRREYNNTINDLFDLHDMSANPKVCAGVEACNVGEERCTQGMCEALPCNVRAFVFDSTGRVPNTVHVAGSFNNWPSNPDEGLKMAYKPEINAWYVEGELPEGEITYKFVIDGQEWLTDPANPDRQSDGFGGENSVLNVSCEANNTGGNTSNTEQEGWAKNIPNEPRKGLFTYDHHASLLHVTPIHLDTYLSNAKILGKRAAENPGLFSSCDINANKESCAREFVSELGKRAFRRPLTPEQLTRYTKHILDADDPKQGMEIAARIILSSPYFLYRFELGDSSSPHPKLDDFEIATALSYFYWGTTPDKALLDAAERGELSTVESRRIQIDRLIEDPRARAQFRHFTTMWLGLERLTHLSKNPSRFPTFTKPLREDLLEETLRFVEHVTFEEKGTIQDLLQASYTFINPRLADFYGMTGAPNQGWSKTERTQARRHGLLGHASILASTSHSDETSPILRGLFVRYNLLCQEFPPPPANAGNVPDVDPNATTRERFAQHSNNDSCNSCHQYIDDIGFALENFDTIGQWRTTEHGKTIDATGTLRDVEGIGKTSQQDFEGPQGLIPLLARSQAVKSCMTRQMFRFAYGYQETIQDRCAVESLFQTADEKQHRILDVWKSVGMQAGFVLRR